MHSKIRKIIRQGGSCLIALPKELVGEWTKVDITVMDYDRDSGELIIKLRAANGEYTENHEDN